MPIEIKELHIRLSVNTPSSSQPPAGQIAAGGGAKSGDEGNDGKDAIVAECVEQVLHILQSKRDR
jgi:hypothetical protein